MSFFLESLITMLRRPNLFSIAVLLATVAVAAVPAKGPPVTEDEATSNIVVLGYHCDEIGAISSIAIATDGPGPHLLEWNNRKICGEHA